MHINHAEAAEGNDPLRHLLEQRSVAQIAAHVAEGERGMKNIAVL
jgi:hypothetical protein